MKVVIDNQLSVALAHLIRNEFGVEAIHVAEVGLREATDRELWSYASASASVLVSKDEDFIYLAARAPSTTFVWWVRLGNCDEASC